MAQINLTLTAETELLHDAANDLLRAHEALAGRHGDRFRQLERRIETVGEAIVEPGEAVALEPGRWIFAAPPAWLALIAQAKAMGVI